MDSATPFDVSGGSGKPRSRLQKTAAIFCRQWPYIGFAIVLAVLNILLAIWSMSYLRFKKEPLLFSLVCLCTILGLAQFASLCYLFRSKVDDNTEPMMIDVGHSFGVVLLFSVSGVALTVPLPAKCYLPKNDLVLIGRNWCNILTTIAVSSWLAVITMIIATSLTYVAVCRAIELAKMPPPVLPEHTAEGPVMRWLSRNEISTERYIRHFP